MRISALILSVFLAALAANPASAHYYAWQDADYKFTMAFPDLWKEQGGLPGDARIKILAPGVDQAQCSIYAKKDRRFVIYPRDYLTDVVAQEIQWDFWEQAVANYDDLYFYYDNYGGLGAGDARYTLVDYIDTTTEPGVRKRAWVTASIYGDMDVMVHCSSTIESFEKHAADFGQVAQSVQFSPQYTHNIRGYYRDFLETKEYNIHWHEPLFVLLMPSKSLAAAANCPRSENYKACLYKRKPPQTQVR